MPSPSRSPFTLHCFTPFCIGPMRVTVLTGGTSSERDVALASAVQVVAALRSRGHDVAVVDTARGLHPASGRGPSALRERSGSRRPPSTSSTPWSGGCCSPAWATWRSSGTPTCCSLHCTEAGVRTAPSRPCSRWWACPTPGAAGWAAPWPWTRTSPSASSGTAGVPTADWVMAPARSRTRLERDFGWPVVVKPSKQGSTVGLTVVKAPADYRGGGRRWPGRYDDEVMIERFVPGRELTVGVLEGQALAVGEIIPRHEIFDYECKYTPGMSEEIFPADLPARWPAECRRLGLLAHEALKLGRLLPGRFSLDTGGELFCLEVNTLPGMTATSLLPQSARAVGIEFPDLCERICRTARLGRLEEPS